MSFDFPKISIITGHYGSGKTNLSVNIALSLAAEGKKVTVVDLDIVNPYFRTADFQKLFDEHGIELKAPMYANSNLDIPALNYDISSIINSGKHIVIDVGGDDAGAIALGRYSDAFMGRDDVRMYYVINCYRYLTKEPEEALELMRQIEIASQLKCSGIINNSNIGTATTGEKVTASLGYAEKVAAAADLPVIFTAGKAEFLTDTEKSFPVDIYVKQIWQ